MSLSSNILNMGRLSNRSMEVINREIDEELNFHIECRTQELITGGMTPALAAEEANRCFGDCEQIRRKCRVINQGKGGWLLAGMSLTILVSILAIGCLAMLLKISHLKNEKMLALVHSFQQQENFDLTGKVVGENGERIASATVLLIHKSWPGSYVQTDHQTTTDENGKFTFSKQYSPDVQNAFLVTILAEGHTMLSEYVVCKPKARAQAFQFKLKPAMEKTFIVQDRDGEPMADTVVYPGMRTQGSKDHLIYDQSGQAAGYKTDAEGRVKMSLFAAKDKVQLRTIDGADKMDFVVDEQAEQKVGTLEDSQMESGIRGKLIDESGQPVEKAKVLLIHKTWKGGYAQSNSETESTTDGNFTFPDCNEPGEQEAFLVTIIHDGSAFESQYVVKEAGDIAEPFEFRLTAAVKKTFLLLDDSGKPLKNQKLALAGRKDAQSKEHLIYEMSQGSVSFKTDRSGKVRLNFFGAGDTATLNVGGNVIEFEVSDDAEQTIDLKKKVNQRQE